MKALSLLFFFVFSSASFAFEEPSDRGCRQEVMQFCKDVKREDMSARRECVDKNMDKFSPKCQEKFIKMRENKEKMKSICKDDIQKYCNVTKDYEDLTKAERKDMRQCVKANESKFTAQCQAIMKEVHEKCPCKGKKTDKHHKRKTN